MDRDTQRLMMGATQLQAGQVEFTAPGTYQVTVPDGVNSMSALTCQSGQGSGTYRAGNGGNLRGKNAIPVVPREVLTVIVGALGLRNSSTSTAAGTLGGHAMVMRGSTVLLASSTPLGNGVFGGDGGVGSAHKAVTGDGSSVGVVHGGGGGGAGGYSGKGGDGGHADVVKNGVLGKAEDGVGGASAGGGTRTGVAQNSLTGWVQGWNGQDGGGTFLRGQGASGIGQPTNSSVTTGRNGSESGAGVAVGAGAGAPGTIYNTTGLGQQGLILLSGKEGFAGGVRLIWPGDVRQYPSSMTNDI